MQLRCTLTGFERNYHIKVLSKQLNIPFFDKYPIKGIKALDFSDFKLIANLMYNKKHLTEQGLSEIQSIKLNMNLFRKL